MPFERAINACGRAKSAIIRGSLIAVQTRECAAWIPAEGSCYKENGLRGTGSSLQLELGIAHLQWLITGHHGEQRMRGRRLRISFRGSVTPGVHAARQPLDEWRHAVGLGDRCLIRVRPVAQLPHS